MTLGDKLRKARESKGLKQIEAAALLGINNVNLNRYEKNVNEPDNAMIIKLANFYSVSVDYLLGIVADPQAQEVNVRVDTRKVLTADPVMEDLKRRMLEAIENMDPKIAEEVIKRAETAAEVFPKDKPDAPPVRKMA